MTDKVVQAKVNMTIAQQAMSALQENISRADEGGRAHEFTRLTIINQKVTVLGAEAENCIGEDLSFVGATRVDVEIDPLQRDHAAAEVLAHAADLDNRLRHARARGASAAGGC